MIQAIYWQGSLEEGEACLLDQTLLPTTKKTVSIETPEQMWQAIHSLKVRGAPAIGVAAGFGVLLGIRNVPEERFFEELEKVCDYLASSRPTAVNLFWALDRMKRMAQNNHNRPASEVKQLLWQEAQNILEEDRRSCSSMADYGAALVKEGANILTHCNTGALATAGCGTALGVCFAAKHKNIHVYVDETRPLLQGSRLTAWELLQENVPMTLICDNAAGFLMQQNKVDIVFVGADRIAANGDTANKIGTYSVAALAHLHQIPFYVVAPFSTFDLSLTKGSEIPIEERSKKEIVQIAGVATAPPNAPVYAPAFDVTPAKYITGIVTDKGILYPPYEKAIQEIA